MPQPRQECAISTTNGEDFRARRLALLSALERKILWLAVWMIHHANHIRPKADGLKVGGHQASCASAVTLMTALYLDVLQPWDRVAVKPHASPVFHAIQYLLGRQTRENLKRFRAFGGAQSYPSRTKDSDDVDFSTGSVGLGVAMTSFAALVQDYLAARGGIEATRPAGRMIALLGDAEFDEGNVFEALLESWKQGVRNVWWIIDYNRQSLDGVTPDRLVERIGSIVRDMEWDVVVLKYGTLMEQAFRCRGGDVLRDWVDACPNTKYSALAYQGGAAWRRQLLRDRGDASGVRELLDQYDDESLHKVMTNLAGHDHEAVLEAFHSAREGQPTCFMAYTIKGYGLPMAGHKDNHSGLMTAEQIDLMRARLNIPEGQEWEPFAGLEDPPEQLATFLASVPFAQSSERRYRADHVAIPSRLALPAASRMSTQEGFGRLLAHIAREHPILADRIVTASPDVASSTNLGSWINRRGVFHRLDRDDADSEVRVSSLQNWTVSPNGQHIELGITENNLFILLAALGLAGPLFGTRLFPIGTLYDPFICRGLDALNYACYQDARFILVATPSGITLGPEGGAHQSVFTPLIGIGQPSLTTFEPAYVDELCEILRWSFNHLQADDGGSVCLRLSTRSLAQAERTMTRELSDQVLEGGYWFTRPGKSADVAVVVCGALVPEAIEAHHQILEDIPGAGLLVVTSADRLQRGWIESQRSTVFEDMGISYVERLLEPLPPHAGLVTLIDGHAATLSWLGAVRSHRVIPLGVERFGQSGDIVDLYREYGIDADAIISAVARLCLRQH